jgi:DNA-binding GntR family transcriptional regulator
MNKVVGIENFDATESGSASSTVYKQIRRDILNVSLQPHTKLRIEPLCKEYGVGASPIREALNRLSAERLVIQKDQKGFRVAPVSAEDFKELTRARRLLNEVLLRESIAHGDALWEENLLIAYHRLSRVPPMRVEDPSSRNPDWLDRHKTFHRALLAGSQSEILLAVSDDLFDLAERYRLLSRLASGRRDAQAEHKALMEATMDRQTDLSIKLLNDHIQRTTDGVVSQLSFTPPDASSPLFDRVSAAPE